MNRSPMFTLLLISLWVWGAACDPKGSGVSGEAVDCDMVCGTSMRACELEACCSCAKGGGSFFVLESYPPQYSCQLGVEGEGGPLEGWSADCDWGSCEDVVTVLDDAATQSVIGLDAQSVIDEVSGAQDATLSWSGGERDELLLGVGSETTVVHYTVTHTNGEIRSVESIWQPPEDLPNLEGACTSRMEVDFGVELATEDGALAENFVGTVRTVAEGESFASSLSYDFGQETLGGTLTVTPSGPEFSIASDLKLRVQYGEAMPQGRIGVDVMEDGGEWVGFGHIQIASWPE